MRKFLFICFSLLFCVNVYSEEKRADNGFGVKLFVGIPKNGYGMPIDNKINGCIADLLSPERSPTFGLSIDSRWYLTKPGKWGLAINARWADVSYSYYRAKCYTMNFSPWENQYIIKTGHYTSVIDLSALGVGLLGTYSFNEKMGLDLYYNVAPNLMILRQDVSDQFPFEYNKHIFALGAAHYVGLGFHYKIFQVGLDLKLARPEFKDWGDEKNLNENDPETRFRTTNLRFFVGFKF